MSKSDWKESEKQLLDNDYMNGDVAQLGERYVRNVQVVGSIPISSIFESE